MQDNYDLSSLDFTALARDYDYFSGYSEGRWSDESHSIPLPFSSEVVREWIGMVSGHAARASLVFDIVQYFAVKNDEWILSTYPDWGDERDLEQYSTMGQLIVASERNTEKDMPILKILRHILSITSWLLWDNSHLPSEEVDFQYKLLGMLWTSKEIDGLSNLPWYRIAELLYTTAASLPEEDYRDLGACLNISMHDVEMALVLGEVLDLPDKFFIWLPSYGAVKKELSSSDLGWIKDKLFYYLHAWAKKTNNPTYQFGRLLTIGLGPVLGLTAAEVHNETDRMPYCTDTKDLSVLVSEEIEKSLAGGTYKAKLQAEDIQESARRLREKLGDLKTLLLADLLQDYLDKIERGQEAYAVEPDADRNPDVNRDEELDHVAEMLMDVEMSEPEGETDDEDQSDWPKQEMEDEQHNRATAFIAAVIEQAQ